MANPIHMLGQGIALANWPMVKEAYEILSGEKAPEQFADVVVKEKKSDVSLSLVRTPIFEIGKTIVASGVPYILSEPVLPTNEVMPPHRVNVEDFRIRKNENPQRNTNQVKAPIHFKEENKKEPTRNRETLKRRGEPTHSGKKQARTESYIINDSTANVFDDNLTESKTELLQDRILIEKGVRANHRMVENRNPVNLVEVECSKCNEVYNLPEADALTSRAGCLFVCDECLSNAIRNRN